MSKILRRFSPRRAATDFLGQWRQPTPHRWKILGVACAATFAMFVLFVPDSRRMAPPPPEVTYISTLDETRTDAQIIAANCANEELQAEIEARVAEREELRRDLYRALGRATFVDVDQMEREIAAEQAAEAEGGPTEEELALSVAEYCANALEG